MTFLSAGKKLQAKPEVSKEGMSLTLLTSCAVGHLENVETVFLQRSWFFTENAPWGYEATEWGVERGRRVSLWPRRASWVDGVNSLLKNQPTPLFSLSLLICKSPLPVGHLGYPWCFFTACNSLFPGRPTPWSCFCSSQPPREATVGSREEEHGGTLQERDWSGFLLVARGGEQLSPALHLGLFMKYMSHSGQCHTPGLGRPSNVQVQGVPPPWVWPWPLDFCTSVSWALVLVVVLLPGPPQEGRCRGGEPKLSDSSQGGDSPEREKWGL